MSILGLDIGTTGVKAAIFRDDGTFVAAPYREYDLVSPRPGHLELDPRRVWAGIRDVITAAVAATRDDPLRSIATSTLGEAAVPVDAENRPVGGAIVGFDARGEDQARALRERLDDAEVYGITGHAINGCHTLFKMLWRREHDPEMFARTRSFLCFGDFAQACLGVEPHVDWSMAARTLAFDVHELEWSSRILDAAGLSPDLLPPVVAPGTAIGTVGKNDLGLPADCVVSTGLHDQAAGILGAGIRPGESMLATGTVICLGVRLQVAPRAGAMVANNLCYYPTAGDRQYISIAYNFTGGSLLKWYRDHLAGDEIRRARETAADPYDVICAGLPEAPTDLLVLPHFATTGTPWLDPRALGAVLGLRLTTTREELVKAILEGVVHEVKLNSAIYAQAGVDIASYKAIGGAAKSRTWMQIAADILARPVAILAVDEVAGLGAAIVGARAAGVLASEAQAQELVDRCARTVAVLEPRADHVARYAERFAIYRDVYPTTRRLSHRIFALSE